jgi:hypothetical protein
MNEDLTELNLVTIEEQVQIYLETAESILGIEKARDGIEQSKLEPQERLAEGEEKQTFDEKLAEQKRYLAQRRGELNDMLAESRARFAKRVFEKF